MPLLPSVIRWRVAPLLCLTLVVSGTVAAQGGGAPRPEADGMVDGEELRAKVLEVLGPYYKP